MDDSPRRQYHSLWRSRARNPATHRCTALCATAKNVTFCALVLLGMLIIGLSEACAQGMSLPYEETFDGVVPPSLPAGWRSSTVRVPGSSDFACVTSSPYSPPQAIMATNATVEQWVATPLIDCRTGTPGRLTFAVRRSSTFAARCIVEVSVNGGESFDLIIGEAPPPGSSSSYAVGDLPLPGTLAGQSAVVIRWHILPETTGVTGTFRMDDVRMTVALPDIPRGAVVVNEIQFQPAAGEPEWIELYNTGAEPVDLKGWTISDASMTTSHRLSALPFLLPAFGFTVVTGDSAAFRSAWPREFPVLVQSEGFPSLNNAGDLVFLRTVQGRSVDSIWYLGAWGGGTGVSLERVDPLSGASTTQNWGKCHNTAGATPGRTNSIVIRDHDLRAGTILLASENFPESLLLQALIYNAGRQPSDPFTVRVFDDHNRDSVGADEEVVTSACIAVPIPSKDSLLVDLFWSKPSPGSHQVVLEIVWPEDQRSENNTSVATIKAAIPRGMLCVNEIHAAPLGGTAEYVEIANAGGSAVELTGCWITDRPLPSGSVNRWPVTTVPRRLRAGELHVVAGDSAVLRWVGVVSGACTVVNTTGLGLNNEGDCVIVHGPDGSVLDSVAYTSSWHSANVPDPAGRSLEKYSPQLPGTDSRNWGTCVDPSGGTPGGENSILITVLPSRATLTCAPDPFSPDGDGFNDVTVVRYQLPLRSALIRLRVFDIRGRCVRDLLNTDPAGNTGNVVWDGYDNNCRPLRIGIYVLFLEAIDVQGGSIVAAKKAVVLARRL